MKFTLKSKGIEKGSDGIYRATFDTYLGGDSYLLAKAFTLKTKQNWFSLGCFMDCSCIGTRIKPKIKRNISVNITTN